jgi:ABC-type nitrate/sulfonate/bicarbonate transport system ATPase subunit
MLEIKNLSVRYAGRPEDTVSGISLRVPKGQVVALLGPTGSGKSSILHGMIGILDANVATVSGELILEGSTTAITAERERPVGIAFQRPAFFSWLSLAENVRSIIDASDMHGATHTEKFALLDELMAEFGLWEQRDKLPHQASGGMLARLNIIRAMCAGERYLLIDESLSGVDEVLRDKIAAIIRDFTAKLGRYTLLVTHSLYDASSYADAALVLSGSPLCAATPVFESGSATTQPERMKLLKTECLAHWYGGAA